MSKESDLPTFKDQVASVSADCRPVFPSRDVNCTSSAAVDANCAALVKTVEPPPLTNNSVWERGVSVSPQPLSTRSSENDHNPSRSATSANQLPTAVAIFGNEDNPIGNGNNNSRETTNRDHEQQKHFSWMAAIAWTSLVVIIVAGAVVGGVCGSGGCGGGTPAVEEAPTVSSGNTASPATAMPFSPLKSPTTSPADLPEPSPVSLPTVTNFTREKDITIFINGKSYAGVYLAPNGTSPEERALQWLIYEDPLQLNVGAAEADEFRLLQRYSLLTLWFQSKTGMVWSKSTNWTNADECTWHRIVCNDARVVQRIRLFGLRLGGTLSPDLGLLTDLTELDINSNNLSGSLPSQIGLWSSLTDFNVSSNHLKGSLPSQIGLLTSLTNFDASSNGLNSDSGLTGSLPTEIGLWTNLTKFYVDSNDLTGSLPSEIGSWTNLMHFDVFFNGLNGTLPSEMGLWASLTYFSVGNNYLSGSLPSEFGLWRNMKVASVFNNRLKGSLPSEMGLWTNLSYCSLAANVFSGTLPSEIGLWTSLTFFVVLANNFTGTIPETIANWTLIEDAWFNENNFTGSMPDAICEFISGNDFLTTDCELPCSCCTRCT